ncbi:MAG: bifunctional DNA-formamidopyrimidine glycosylase/DNA-(apurinic or apyrimidinic site) lyase [Pseudomonadota bacterium]
MPELPEVETTLQGIQPFTLNSSIKKFIIRNPNLRWPIDTKALARIRQEKIIETSRRGKYLIITTAKGHFIIHLGMSGSLRIIDNKQLPQKHDHFDICLDSGIIIRYNDPRRFGCLLFTTDSPMLHDRLKHLGPEPLTRNFNAKQLYKDLNQRKVAIKSAIMDSKIVVGVGNIYATEALFLARINPQKPANSVSLAHLEALVKAIKHILKKAIKSGGTTLRDFVNSDGKPGYFVQELKVYGRAGEACKVCTTRLELIKQNQRTTVFCPKCQS